MTLMPGSMSRIDALATDRRSSLFYKLADLLRARLHSRRYLCPGIGFQNHLAGGTARWLTVFWRFLTAAVTIDRTLNMISLSREVITCATSSQSLESWFEPNLMTRSLSRMIPSRSHTSIVEHRTSVSHDRDCQELRNDGSLLCGRAIAWRCVCTCWP